MQQSTVLLRCSKCIFDKGLSIRQNPTHEIYPSKIVLYKKLCAICNGLNAEYKGEFSRFVMSGTQFSNFYHFYNGRQDSYYLRKHLGSKPNLFPPSSQTSKRRPSWKVSRKQRNLLQHPAPPANANVIKVVGLQRLSRS